MATQNVYMVGLPWYIKIKHAPVLLSLDLVISWVTTTATLLTKTFSIVKRLSSVVMVGNVLLYV